MKPCLMGIILATGIYMAVSIIFPEGVIFENLFSDGVIWGNVFSGRKGSGADMVSLFILLFLIAAILLVRWIRKKELSPIMMIVLVGFLGAVLY